VRGAAGASVLLPIAAAGRAATSASRRTKVSGHAVAARKKRPGISGGGPRPGRRRAPDGDRERRRPSRPQLTKVPSDTHKRTEQERDAVGKPPRRYFRTLSHSDRVYRTENRFVLGPSGQESMGVGNQVLSAISLTRQQNFLMRIRRHFR